MKRGLSKRTSIPRTLRSARPRPGRWRVVTHIRNGWFYVDAYRPGDVPGHPKWVRLAKVRERNADEAIREAQGWVDEANDPPV